MYSSRTKNVRGFLAVIMALFMLSACAVFITTDVDATVEADTSWYDDSKDSFEIGSVEELFGLAKLVNEGNTFEGKTIELIENIDLDVSDWKPIGDGTRKGSGYEGPVFKGVFDGNGCIISNLVMNTTDGISGLFGIVAGGTVKDINMAGVNIESGDVAASVVAMLCEGGTVSGCSTDDKSSITAPKYAGGIVGSMTISGIIQSCVNHASVTGTTYNTGGIVGAAYYTVDAEKVMTIDGCINHGNVAGVSGVGGMVGLSTAYITDCVNHGDISSTDYAVGGIVGEQKILGDITNCVNYGDVVNDSNNYGSAGIVGWIRYLGLNSVDYPYGAIITVSKNENYGAIDGGNDAGGIVGTLYDYGIVKDNLNDASSLKASTFAGGIVGNYQSPSEVPLFEVEHYQAIITDNISSTPIDKIEGNCKDLFNYNNDVNANPDNCLVENNILLQVITEDMEITEVFSGTVSSTNGNMVTFEELGVGAVIDSETLEVTGDNVTVKTIKVISGDVVSVSLNGVEAIELSEGASLTINVTSDVDTKEGTAIFGIDSRLKDLTISGDGKLIVDVNVEGTTTTIDGMTLDSIGIYAKSLTISADVDVLVNESHDQTKGMKSAGIVAKGIIIGGSEDVEVKVTAHAGNRGVYIPGDYDLTVSEESVLDAFGYEKGIRAEGDVIVNGTIVAEVCNVNKGVNGAGVDDRHGLKVNGSVTVFGTLTSESIIADSIYVTGTVNVIYDADAGKGASGDVPAILPGLDGDTTLSGDGVVFVDEGNVINSTFSADGNSVTLTNVEAGQDGIIISVGSIVLSGSSVAGSVEVYSGEFELSGTHEIDIVIEAGAEFTVPAGEELILEEGVTITMGAGSTLNVYGEISADDGAIQMAQGVAENAMPTINAVDPSAVQDIVSDELKGVVDEPEEKEVEVSEEANSEDVLDAIREALETSNEVVINGEGFTIDKDQSLVIPEGKSVELNVPITVSNTTAGSDETGMIIKGHIEGDGMIIVLGYLELDGADVRVPVIEVGDDAYIYIKNAKEMSVSGNQTADLGVGYGNTLVLKDLEVPAGKNVQAWGIVIVEGTVTVEDGAAFNVYMGGDAIINGDLVIEGDVVVNGHMEVAGSIKVTDDLGRASFTVAPGFELDSIPTGITLDVDDILEVLPIVDVKEGATFDVLKAKSKEASTQNSLSSAGLFNVEGTLNVTGDVSGIIVDSGTFNINGEVSSILFVIMTDGTSMTVGSIDGSMIAIPMMGIQELIEERTASDVLGGIPVVSVGNVGGVTITASYETVNFTDDDEKKRAHLFGLDVSGTLKAINDDVEAFDGETAGFLQMMLDLNDDIPDSVGSSFVNVGDITLGKNTGLSMQGDVMVSGTVTAVADYIRVDADGPINVEGTIVIGDGCITNPDNNSNYNDLQVNGAKYTITDNTKGETTTYYTTLENALAAVSTADEKTIEVLGTIEVATELEVSAEATVIAKGEITIDVDGKITVAEKALLNVEDGSVIVDGMLVIMDKEYGLEGDNLTYQVFTETETTATYSGLVLALRNASEGDTITIVGETAKIEKSVTIPEGVTLVVPSKAALTIGSADEKVVLTVAGTLKVTGGAVDIINNDNTEVKVPGVIMFVGDLTTGNTVNHELVDEADDYVRFTMKVDGKVNTVYSNLAYAAENATDGDVTVFGDVTGGDVTFTMGEKSTGLLIEFEDEATLTVSTMTFVSNEKGSVEMNLMSGEFTGTLASAAGSVDLVKVSGVYFSVYTVIDVDGSTDVMTVDGVNESYDVEGFDGKMSVASGTVTVGYSSEYYKLVVGDSKDDILTIASGATLLVPEGMTLGISTMESGVDPYYGLIVDGTLAVDKGTVTINGEVLVNGGVDIIDSTNVVVDSTGKLVVLGTVTASSTEENVVSNLNVKGILIVGSAPALGANGAIVGDLEITGTTAYAIAYAGADMSAADINEDNGKNVMFSTEIVLNGVPYMTVYTDDPTEVDIADIKKYMETEGYDISTLEWPTGVDDNTKIGTFESLEAEMELDNVDKVTVSAGVGLQIYVDGIKAVSGMDLQYGTHIVTIGVEKNYDGSNATITVNGVQVANGGTFTIDVDDKEVVIIASGAVPAQSGSTVVVDEDDGMKLTDILLIVLVVLIVIMAIIVALRMMRS